MIVEVVCVGTELLLGQTVNTNAAVIGSRLAEAGLDHFHQVVVGDNLDRVETAIGNAMARADAVIVTGGLGPTDDDLTREAIATACRRPLEVVDEYVEALRRRWERRGREMPASNIRQAERPAGAQFIPNAKGTAPGLALDVDGTWVFALPGVPAEMLPMLEGFVIPSLREVMGETGVVASRLIRTWGMSESQVADLLTDLYAGAVNPSLAYLTTAGEIKVRLTAKAADHAEAARLIAPLEAEVRRRLGGVVFGVDDDTVEQVLLGVLRAKGWSIATAESVTGGLVAARLTSVPGASDVVTGGIVAYSAAAKKALLGVPDEALADGQVSEAVALAMADGVAQRTGAEVAVAVTGSAGPTALERPPGTVVVGVRTPDQRGARTLALPGDRERVRAYATTAALHLTRRALAGEQWTG